MRRSKASGPPTGEAEGINGQLNQQLSALDLGNLVKLAEEFCDMEVQCVPTGFPGLDHILHPKLKGFPLGRDIELFSREPELGKSSLSLEFLKATQRNSLKTLYGDVERTMTLSYLRDQGLQIRPDENPERYAIRLMRHEHEAIPAEVWLDTFRKVSNLFDLIVVDSVAALEKKANLEKAPGEANQVGGLSLLLSEFYRKNVAKKASILWINQMRTKIGGYSPTGAVPLDTTGGKAIKFYASIRIELSYVDKIRETKDGEPVGMKVKAFTAKNKVAPQWRQTNLSYIFGYGFSPIWDYMDLAQSMGVVEKKGSWVRFGDEVKAQGMLGFHRELAARPDAYARLRHMVDGEDVAETLVTTGDKPEDVED